MSMRCGVVIGNITWVNDFNVVVIGGSTCVTGGDVVGLLTTSSGK